MLQPGKFCGVHRAAAAQRPYHGPRPAQRWPPNSWILHCRREENQRHIHLLPVSALQAVPRGGHRPSCLYFLLATSMEMSPAIWNGTFSINFLSLFFACVLFASYQNSSITSVMKGMVSQKYSCLRWGLGYSGCSVVEPAQTQPFLHSSTPWWKYLPLGETET